MLGSVRLTCGLLFPGGKLFDVLCLGCCFISVWCLLPVLSNVKQHIFCDISETFTSAASLVSQSVARKALMLSGVKWCIWSGRLACLQATDPCSGAGKVPAVVFCCPLSLICLSLPGIHLLLSHRAQQRTPSCTLHKAQLLNKRRLQAGGIPAAGVSQRRQKRKHANASFWGTRGRWRGRAEKRTGLNRVHRWRSDDLLAWEWMSPWGCWCLDQTHSVQTDPSFREKAYFQCFILRHSAKVRSSAWQDQSVSYKRLTPVVWTQLTLLYANCPGLKWPAHRHSAPYWMWMYNVSDERGSAQLCSRRMMTFWH